MLIDLHTHIWKKEHIDPQGSLYRGLVQAGFPESNLLVTEERHYHHAMTGRDPLSGPEGSADPAPDRVVVLGFMTRHAGVSVSPQDVWNYISTYNKKDTKTNRLVGFACVDALSETLIQDLHEAYDMGFRGIKCIPVYQGVHPLSKEMYVIYQFCSEKKLPILIHQNTTFIDNGNLTHCRPSDLSQVAAWFPKLKMVIAHIGHPWCEETVCLIRMNRNMYTDISGVSFRRQQFYRALSFIEEYHVWEKVFFGTDFPFQTYEEGIRRLRTINEIDDSGKTGGRARGQIAISFDQIEKMIHRDSLDILGVPV